MRTHVVLVSLGIVLVMGCVGPMGSKHVPKIVASKERASIQSYQLGPNDALRIDVFDEPELRTETEVSGHGTIKFPLLGELDVEGLTLKEVEDALISRLKTGYLKNPKVTLSIIRFRNFYVGGEAKNPGAFPFQEGLTVLKAITLAGGWTDKATKSRAKVLREVTGEQSIISVGMDEFIQPDDIVIVPESFF